MGRYKRPTHIGLKVKLKIPQLYLPLLEVIDNESIGMLIREALRSACRPSVVVLKSILKSKLLQSEQSTGATERAVGFKVGRSKLNPNVFYAVIGIEKTHYELHTAVIPAGYITKLKRGKLQKGAGLLGLQVKRNKKGIARTKQVFSRYRDQNRIQKLGSGTLKRWPKKYFHLIDKGFNHFYAKRFVEGYEFIRQLDQAVRSSMQETLNKRLRDLVVPTIQREMLRKLKGVFK